MRITRIWIESWRNFRNLEIVVPRESNLVCLVGENGVGKSGILELISAVSSQIGISNGLEILRGNPTDEPHSISVTFDFSEDIPGIIDLDRLIEDHGRNHLDWDRTVTFQSSGEQQGNPNERGIEYRHSIELGGINWRDEDGVLIEHIRRSIQEHKEAHYLYLDADRAYPPFQLQQHQYWDALSQDWESKEFNRQFSARATKTMYEQWIQYFLAREAKFATQHLAASREARDRQLVVPEFTDIFDDYKMSVQEVLPHLHFRGVDTERRTLLFESGMGVLAFSSLSGGEREIAFILGQVDRFKLRTGLFLIDEPELHLNPALVRNWLEYLRSTMESGQVWIATHSLEAAEVAGPEATILIERDEDTREVGRAQSLVDRPVVALLTATLGAPGFAISRHRYVLVEGDRAKGERQRYFRMIPDSQLTRFLESGMGDEVVRKVGAIRELADETDDQIRIGGVVDGDAAYWDPSLINRLPAEVHTLGCHEIENVFLQPAALDCLLQRNNLDRRDVAQLTLQGGDRCAGIWLAQGMVLAGDPERIQELRSQSELIRAVKMLDWGSVQAQCDSEWSGIRSYKSQYGDASEWLKTHLSGLAEKYGALRGQADFWLWCPGKQTMAWIAKEIGFVNTAVLESNVLELWRQEVVEVPTAVMELRRFVTSL